MPINDPLRAQLVQEMLRQVERAMFGLVLLDPDKEDDQHYGLLYAHGKGVLAAVRPLPDLLSARAMYKAAKVPAILAKLLGSFPELAFLLPRDAPVLVIESQPQALTHLSRFDLWKLTLEAIRKQVESSGATPERPFFLLISGPPSPHALGGTDTCAFTQVGFTGSAGSASRNAWRFIGQRPASAQSHAVATSECGCVVLVGVQLNDVQQKFIYYAHSHKISAALALAVRQIADRQLGAGRVFRFSDATPQMQQLLLQHQQRQLCCPVCEQQCTNASNLQHHMSLCPGAHAAERSCPTTPAKMLTHLRSTGAVAAGPSGHALGGSSATHALPAPPPAPAVVAATPAAAAPAAGGSAPPSAPPARPPAPSANGGAAGHARPRPGASGAMAAAGYAAAARFAAASPAARPAAASACDVVDLCTPPASPAPKRGRDAAPAPKRGRDAPLVDLTNSPALKRPRGDGASGSA